LSACVPFRDTSPFFGTIAAALGGAGEASGSAFTRAQVENLRYASLQAWFDRGPKALIILAEAQDRQRLLWRSAERQSITTFGPFVVSALGIDPELRDTSFQGKWSSDPREMVGTRATRVLDVAVEGERALVHLESRFEVEKRETLTILERTYDLQRVTEVVSSGGRNRYENHYWIEPSSGRYWKSRQIVVPTLPPLNIEILKPAT